MLQLMLTCSHLQVKPTHTFKGIAVLPEKTWNFLLQLNRTIHLKLQRGRPQKEPQCIDPLVLVDPFTRPQRYTSWLDGMVEELQNIERALYGSHDPHSPLPDSLYERLGALEATAARAFHASTGWTIQEDSHSKVLWLHPAWAGYVPWTMPHPDAGSKPVGKAAEALQVRSAVRQCSAPILYMPLKLAVTIRQSLQADLSLTPT